eukprot:346780-Ditylum_brightwellii.AAC.1
MKVKKDDTKAADYCAVVAATKRAIESGKHMQYKLDLKYIFVKREMEWLLFQLPLMTKNPLTKNPLVASLLLLLLLLLAHPLLACHLMFPLLLPPYVDMRMYA